MDDSGSRRVAPATGGVETDLDLALRADAVRAGVRDSRFADWLPAVVLVAPILLSPFLHDAATALTHAL